MKFRFATMGLCALAMVTACTGNGYQQRGDEVHFRYNDLKTDIKRTLEGVDTGQFQILNRLYAKDGAHVYYFGEVLDGADAQSFRLLESSYAIDINNVYWRGQPLAGADLGSFEVLNHAWAKDKDQAYLSGEQVAVCDAPSFNPDAFLNRGRFRSYGADDECVYYVNRLIEGADPATLKPMDARHSRDANGCYFEELTIPCASVATTQDLIRNGQYYEAKQTALALSETAP